MMGFSATAVGSSEGSSIRRRVAIVAAFDPYARDQVSTTNEEEESEGTRTKSPSSSSNPWLLSCRAMERIAARSVV